MVKLLAWARRQNPVALVVYLIAWVMWKAMALGMLLACVLWIANKVG